MRTNIDIDDDLLTEVMRVVGLKTKKAAVEEALRRLLEEHRQREAIAEMAGLGWEGSLEELRQRRRGRVP